MYRCVPMVRSGKGPSRSGLPQPQLPVVKDPEPRVLVEQRIPKDFLEPLTSGSLGAAIINVLIGRILQNFKSIIVDPRASFHVLVIRRPKHPVNGLQRLLLGQVAARLQEHARPPRHPPTAICRIGALPGRSDCLVGNIDTRLIRQQAGGRLQDIEHDGAPGHGGWQQGCRAGVPRLQAEFWPGRMPLRGELLQRVRGLAEVGRAPSRAQHLRRLGELDVAGTRPPGCGCPRDR